MNDKDYKFLNFFFPLYFIICYLQARHIIPPYFPEEGIVMWPLRLFVVYIGIKSLSNSYKIPALNIYLIYSLFSIVFYVSDRYPLFLYVNDVAFFISPILMVYVGLNSRDLSDNFLTYTFWSIVGLFVVGLYLYIVNPGWYQDAWVLNYNSRWYKEGMNADFDYIKSNMRFSSFMLTSYATEYFGLFAFPFSLCKMLKATNNKQKTLYIFLSLFILLVIILSLQRAAIGASIAILVVLGIYDMKRSHRAGKFYLLLLISAILFIALYASTDNGSRVLDRFNEFTLENTFSDARVSQNENLFSAWNNIILGNGLGTGGNQARKIGLPAVTDSQYMKILVEQGVIGMLIFLFIIVSTFKRILKNFKYLAGEGAYFAGVVVAMIGSNSLMFGLYMVPFWFTVGRIWNSDYINKKINSNLST